MSVFRVNLPLVHRAVELFLASVHETEYESIPRLLSNGAVCTFCKKKFKPNFRPKNFYKFDLFFAKHQFLLVIL
jgi:hypothetical protein